MEKRTRVQIVCVSYAGGSSGMAYTALFIKSFGHSYTKIHMLKAYKYRIYPNKKQAQMIDKTIDTCRIVYNVALETKIQVWQSAKVNLTAYDLINQLPELKEAYTWMNDVDSQALQAAVKKVDIAFKNFYKGAGYPKFKSKRKGVQSFHCPTNTRRINWQASTLTIPKIKDIPIVIHKNRHFGGTIKMLTISKTRTGKYFASISVDDKNTFPVKPVITEQSTIGIDVGIKSFVITSDGRQFEPNRYLKSSLQRLKCLQRKAARKQKNSNNRKKANKCVAILHEKITNQRNDYIHKLTTQLIRDSQTDCFVIENLGVAGMLKNRKLSHALADASFGLFFQAMKYKCDWYGKNLIVIDRFAPSSKRCSECGEINDALTLADREWVCTCGTRHDRDTNAAKNIKYFGLEKHSGVGSSGEPVESRRIRRVKKQESI